MRWVNWTAAAYYIIGTVYYVYHWFWILGASGLVAAGILTAEHKQPLLTNALTTISIITLIAGVSFWRRRLRLQLAGLNPGLRILEMRVDYQYKSPTDCAYIRNLKVKALHSIDHYRAKFKWSSDGNIDSEVVNGAKDIVASDHSSSVFNMCHVNFMRPLSKHEVLEFGYRLHLQDAAKPVKQYFGHTVEAPIKELILKVRIWENCMGTQFLKQMFLNSTSESPLKEEIVLISQFNREIEWRIPNAQAGYYYQIRW
jgi:hypothetical protein